MPKFLRKLIRKLPKPWRFALMRRMLKLPSRDLPELRVKIAHRREELEQAFSLLYQAYLTSGFMTPNEAELRVTKYHALPSTTTIVAMNGNEVVGTVSLIRDGLFGFPSDRLIDKSSLRSRGVRIAEVSSLAVHEKYRSKTHGAIMWPLIVHLLRYCRDYFGIDYLAIAVHPRQFDFYEGVLFFEKTTPRVIENYSFVNDNPAVCGLLSMRTFFDEAHYHFGKKEKDRNLFHYLFEDQHEFLRFPKRDNFKVSDPMLTPDLLAYFFREKTNVMNEMNHHEIAVLHNLYPKAEYQDVLPKAQANVIADEYRRQMPRYDVNCRGRLEVGSRHVLLKVQNVSEKGFYAIINDDIRFGEELSIRIEVADFQVADLKGRAVWNHPGGAYGFVLHSVDSQWIEFVQRLQADRHQEFTRPPFSMVGS